MSLSRLAPLSLLFISSVAFAAADGPPSPWTTGVILSVTALTIGGSAAVLGLWIGRDKSRPVTFALAMTLLVTSAVGVGCVQSYLDSVDNIKKQADLDRMFGMVGEIAVASGDHELAALIESQGGPKLVIEDAAPPAPEPEEAPEGEE